MVQFDLKGNEITLPSVTRPIFDIFGESVRLVGGPVRDLLLGEQPSDFDFATVCTPNIVIDRLAAAGYKGVDLSNGHGTVTTRVDGEVIEITTLRVDEETDGRHAAVRFVHDWKADAARRDFTFNAMSMNADGELYDYFGGMQALSDAMVRFVGDPNARIEEDYLRIIRYFRFWQRFGWLRFDDTDQAIASNLEGLRQISPERIWSEFKKLKYDERLTPTLSYMKELGALSVVYNLDR